MPNGYTEKAFLNLNRSFLKCRRFWKKLWTVTVRKFCQFNFGLMMNIICEAMMVFCCWIILTTSSWIIKQKTWCAVRRQEPANPVWLINATRKKKRQMGMRKGKYMIIFNYQYKWHPIWCIPCSIQKSAVLSSTQLAHNIRSQGTVWMILCLWDKFSSSLTWKSSDQSITFVT